ncbi:MAG: hypothetical protein IAI50_06185 [Candidatus Eremiobacteraeota bacterium]|nr:hypothetical protein [Candidatus Eremiobacteraeota bacterium]
MKFRHSDPYQLFGAILHRSRLGLQEAHRAAFKADSRCSELQREEQFLGFEQSSYGPDLPFLRGDAHFAGTERRSLEEIVARRDEIWAEAQAEDLFADQQASILVLWADDALRRFARGVLKRAPSFDKGYGVTYGCWPAGEVPIALTTMLRAATNTLRHVSEWDDNSALVFPYDDFKPKNKAEKSQLTEHQRFEENNAEQSIQNIKILRRAFGIGVNERIRDIVSWRTLVAIDGYLGTHAPDYQRFENALVTAAREMADEAGPESRARLEAELTRTWARADAHLL